MKLCRIWSSHSGVIKSSIFWHITPCSPLKVNRQFRDTFRLCLCLLPASRWFLAWFILRPWRLRWHIPPKLRWTFDGLQGIISQKVEFFRWSCGSDYGPVAVSCEEFWTFGFHKMLNIYWSNELLLAYQCPCFMELIRQMKYLGTSKSWWN
jgi:hypothetical protein